MPRSILQRRFSQRGDWQLSGRWVNGLVSFAPQNMSLCPAIARTMNEFDSAVMDILGTNAKDVPFAALYHVENANGEFRPP